MLLLGMFPGAVLRNKFQVTKQNWKNGQHKVKGPHSWMSTPQTLILCTWTGGVFIHVQRTFSGEA